MQENDDKLIEQFLSTGKKEVADNGFTQRVMHRLPDRAHRLSQVWSVCCFTLAAVLFVRLDGLQLTGNMLRETFDRVLENSAATLDFRSLLVVVVVLLVLFYRKVVSLA